jgi:hypothetical protein
MTSVVLPVAALAALRVTSPLAELVARGDGPLHLYRGNRPGDFTPAGALRSDRRLECNTRSRRWYLAEPDGRALCGNCTRWARAHLPLSSPPLTPADLVEALTHATTPEQVDAVQSIALARGVTSVRVPFGQPLRDVALHRVIALTRTRVSPSRVGVVERNWLERRPASRFPRRIA